MMAREVSTSVQRSAWLRNDEGATAIEYGVMAALIAVAMVVSVTMLGGVVRDNLCSPLDAMADAGRDVTTCEE